MTRDDLMFQIGYSIRLEKMQAMLLGRVDRASSFMQLLLGAAVVTNAMPVLTGIAVAALAAFSFVNQPGAKSTQALLQKQRYEKLQAIAPEMEDAELRKQFAEIQETDSQVLGSLLHVAQYGEEVRVGAKPNFELTWFEKWIGRLAGDLPRL